MYEARAVANFVLSNFNPIEFDITNLRLNKLLYFMHGWSLVEEPANGLIRNHFEAWQFGPVVPSVYSAFKTYGDKPITKLAEYLDYATGQQIAVPSSGLDLHHRQLVERVFRYYAPLSTPRLVSLTHENDGAWKAALQRARGATVNVRIPNDLIRHTFLLNSGGGRRH